MTNQDRIHMLEAAQKALLLADERIARAKAALLDEATSQPTKDLEAATHTYIARLACDRVNAQLAYAERDADDAYRAAYKAATVTA